MAKEARSRVREVPGVFVLFSDDTIRLDNVRLSYPHLDAPFAMDDDEGSKSVPKYSVKLLLPKATHADARTAIQGLMRKLLDAQNPPLKNLPSDKKFMRDGDDSGKDEEAGNWTISARETNAPQLRGATLDPKTKKPIRITPEQALNVFYPGCYVSCLIRPWFMKNKWGKRLNANLIAVQFLKDGEPLGEGRLRPDDIDDSFDGDGSTPEMDDDLDDL